MPGVLDNIRVLDLGRHIAGPMAASLLGDLGAEVIRIERVGGGEDRAPYPLGEDVGAAYLAFNRNKKSLTLNPGSPGGREVMRKLIATADIVVVNMPLDAIQKLDLDYESLITIKPDIILVHTSAFGTDGPYADRVGFDGIGQVMSGSAYLSGDPGDPRKSLACWVDVTTAMFNAYGALAAVMHRNATGQGQKVETNLLRSALNLTNAAVIEQALLAPFRTPTGNRGQTSAPSDIHKTTDGFIIVQVAGDTLFKRWCRLVGVEDWIDDPRFASDGERGANSLVLSERTEAWTSVRSTEQALAEMAAAKIPAGPVLSPQQVLDDPHVQEAELYKLVDYPGLDAPAPMIEPGARFSGFDINRNRAPTVGEHTAEILTQLGYSQDDITGLRRDGVI